MIITINPDNPQGRLISRAVEIIASGGLVIYPTDTQYGLGCDLTQKKSIEKIYRLKQRSQKTPFSFVCSGLTDIAQYAKISNFAYRIMKRLLPGPYTFILSGTKLVPQLMLTKRHECGLRVPDHPITLALVTALGRPVINTSAALEGQPIPTDPQDFVDLFKNQVEAVIDGGFVPGKPSTIVSLMDDNPIVLRQGRGPWPV
ncbi:MAG: threonylcarbamoyl-AMP synthase [Candidatus Adiutrix intracellularis]|jgi:tRNA threonylcarbamoyl adenosine modification protein (Sua5/YciO/YrdC/YwlC family)|nr:threonylcarbamoyl-AMP synthase [Candidatus Adiutrix intracellularis]